MRSRHLIQIITLLIALACAAIVLSPPVRRSFRINRVTYLINSHRYVEAFEAAERLTANDPVAEASLGDYGTRIPALALQYHLTLPPPAPQPAREAWETLLHATELRPALAPMTRRLRLEWLTRRQDAPASVTLAAARALLTRDGYDAGALWWTVHLQYDPEQPLKIPEEIRIYREQLARDGDEASTRGPALELRIIHLQALAALEQRDWARAAQRFDEYRRRFNLTPPPDAVPDEKPDNLLTPHVTALLACARAERALALLGEAGGDEETLPAGRCALMFEACLELNRMPQAAMAFQLMKRDSHGATPALKTLCRLLGPAVAADRNALYQSLASPASVTRPAPGRDGSRLWTLLNYLAETDADRAALARGAMLLLESGSPPDPETGLAMTDFALRRGDTELTGRMTKQFPWPDRDGMAGAIERAARTLAGRAAEGGDTTATLQPSAAERHVIGRLLSRDTTLHQQVRVPRGTRLLLCMVQGYPAGDIWPILHFRIEGAGRRTERLCYAHDSRSTAQPLILPCPAMPDADPSEPLTVSISLLNAGGGLNESRSALIAEMLAF